MLEAVAGLGLEQDHGSQQLEDLLAGLHADDLQLADVQGRLGENPVVAPQQSCQFLPAGMLIFQRSDIIEVGMSRDFLDIDAILGVELGNALE